MTETNSSNGHRAIDAILGQLKPRVASTRVLLDQTLVAQHRRLEAELAAAAEHDAKAAGLVLSGRKIADQIIDLEATMEAAKVEFRFQSIGSTAWVALLAKHPPTKEQKRVLAYNPLTFNAAAVAATCVDPVMTEDDALALQERMDAGQWKLVLGACLDANEGGGDALPKSEIAIAYRSLSAISSTTAPAVESPDLGSLAGA